nr:CPBP family intramembrane metalloprotease [Clostridia bacterium]
KYMKKTYPALWQGIVFFAAVIAVMLFVCAPIQAYFGLIGVAITEGILLIMALTAAVLSKCQTSAIFPLTLIPPKRLLGAFMLYGGVYMAIIPATTLMGYFIPELNEVSAGIAEIGTQLSPAAAVIIMAVLPAICEESVFRGFILASHKSLMGSGSRLWKVFTVVSVGVLFGVFHLDILRFPMTAVLGGVFAYIAIESGSMVPTVLLHLVNNLISVMAMYSMSGVDASELEAAAGIAYTPLQLAASCMVYIGIAVLLAFFGSGILKEIKYKKPAVITAVTVSLLLIAVGYIITYATMTHGDIEAIEEILNAAVFITKI